MVYGIWADNKLAYLGELDKAKEFFDKHTTSPRKGVTVLFGVESLEELTKFFHQKEEP